TERGQHAKTHGFVVAKFTVPEGLPEQLRIGLFREPRTYTAVIRFSNTGAKYDTSPDNHGMSIKVLGVKGEKLLEGEEDAETQDFVMIDHPLFFAPDVASTLETDKATDELLLAALQKSKGATTASERGDELSEALKEKKNREDMLNALAERRPK